MTMQQTYSWTGSMDGLPDPDRDPQFYDGVRSRRLAAWFFDVAVILLVGVPVAILFGLATFGFGFALFPLIVAGIGFVYRIMTISSRSATWGMRFMGIELRRHDGSRLDFTTAVLHTGIYTVAFTLFPLQILSCLAILGTRYGQGLQDLALRTAMINRPVD
jgi:uncharacterized RDD family membrane protein YckC